MKGDLISWSLFASIQGQMGFGIQTIYGHRLGETWTETNLI